MDRETMLARRESLRSQVAKLAAQLEVYDELLGDSALPAPEVVRPPALPRQGKPSPAEDASTPAPKVVRPAAPTPAGNAVGYAERVADALFGGPLKTADICAKAGISYPTVSKVLKGRPEWFLQTGAGKSTHWELTEAGRAEATAR